MGRDPAARQPCRNHYARVTLEQWRDIGKGVTYISKGIICSCNIASAVECRLITGLVDGFVVADAQGITYVAKFSTLKDQVTTTSRHSEVVRRIFVDSLRNHLKVVSVIVGVLRIGWRMVELVDAAVRDAKSVDGEVVLAASELERVCGLSLFVEICEVGWAIIAAVLLIDQYRVSKHTSENLPSLSKG